MIHNSASSIFRKIAAPDRRKLRYLAPGCSQSFAMKGMQWASRGTLADIFSDFGGYFLGISCRRSSLGSGEEEARKGWPRRVGNGRRAGVEGGNEGIRRAPGRNLGILGVKSVDFACFRHPWLRRKSAQTGQKTPVVGRS